jgi:ubiquinone/menaquinone biosynthesis C-methylase UbiE
LVRLLDLGCGQGAATLFLASEGFAVTGVDGSHTALMKLAERLAERERAALLVCADMAKTHLQDESFDGVVDIVSLAHNENPRDIVKEMHRVLKPDGRLFSVIPTTETWQAPFMDKGAIQFLNHDEVWDLFGEWFTLQVGWVKELLHSGHVLEHWVIDGIKR